MSKAACIAQKAQNYIGIPYKLGEEFWRVVGREQTKRIDGDCSGLLWALLMDCGVSYKGRKIGDWFRWTADDYWKIATKIQAPSVPGDCCWFPRTGCKTHIAIYIGDDTVIEAGNHGPNNSYPGSGYVGTCTVAQMNARGAVWGRIEGLDIYDEGDDDMTQDQDRILKLVHVSMIAQSNDQEAQIAIAKGDIPKAERLVQEAHDAAMKQKAYYKL